MDYNQAIRALETVGFVPMSKTEFYFKNMKVETIRAKNQLRLTVYNPVTDKKEYSKIIDPKAAVKRVIQLLLQ